MSIEPEKRAEQLHPYSSDLATFVDKDVFTLYREGGFLSPESIPALDGVRPLINLALQAASEAMGNDRHKQLEMGGSLMEMYAGLLLPEEYWAAKKQLKNTFQKHQSEINQTPATEDWRTKALRNAFDVIANGDPDIDLYVVNEGHLAKMFTILHTALNNPETSMTDSGGTVFTETFGENALVRIGFGPVSKTNQVKRLYLQLLDKKEQPIFHIDLTTNSPKTGIAKALNRRQLIGPIHDHCRGQVTLAYADDGIKGSISYNPADIVNPNEPAEINLEAKDIAASTEGTLREERKMISANVSLNNRAHREIFSLAEIYPLLDPNDVFVAREQTSNPQYPIEEIIANQSLHQQQVLFQELLLIAQYDHIRLVTLLQDLGFDMLYFKRHFTRRETHQILHSSYYKYEQYQDSIDPVAASRKASINLDDHDPDKNGAERFICAIGEVFGGNKRAFDTHFASGIAILRDPTLLPEVSLPKIAASLPQTRMMEAIRDWGGLTETGLHSVLSVRYPDMFANDNETDREHFRQQLITLKKSGAVETARRKMRIDGEDREVRFYYVCANPTNFEKVVPDASIIPDSLAPAWVALLQSDITTLEALMSFNRREHEELQIKDARGNSVNYSYVQSVLSFLLSQQRNAEKSQKLKSWVDPSIDD